MRFSLEVAQVESLTEEWVTDHERNRTPSRFEILSP